MEKKENNEAEKYSIPVLKENIIESESENIEKEKYQKDESEKSESDYTDNDKYQKDKSEKSESEYTDNEKDKNEKSESEYTDNEKDKKDKSESEYTDSEKDKKDKSESEYTDNEKDKKKYKCQFDGCKAAFARPSKLKQHENVHENKRPYKCTYEDCEKAYTNPSHLKRHVQSHNLTTNTYKCPSCSANISTLSNLKRHFKRVHDVERELYCKECDTQFRKKSRFDEHMAAHENNFIYKCDKCGKQFATHQKLQRHHESHKSKCYKCPVEDCKEVFDKWALMLKHKRTQHIIEYECSTCHKTFPTKHRLRLHAKTHTENRQALPCPYKNCNRLYYFKHNLDQHITIRHLGKKFECDICRAQMCHKSSIKEHIMKQHVCPETKPPKRKQPEPRQDLGSVKRSILSIVTGLCLKVNVDRQLINRAPAALLRDQAVQDSSFSEDSDFGASRG